MTYEEALDNVYGRLVFGIKPGLERITALMERLGNPQKELKFVHVAGTNGKGTCATLVASALGACGLRVGLYTSPYVLEFRERFQIDGEMIPKEELVEEVETLAPIADQFEESGDQVTEFEYITALALHWFARRQCDIVVLEVGMGGRFDATNVIDVPEVAAIMSISLDHTAILGSTLEKIAFEKAGIVKAGGRLVLYPDQAPAVTQELEPDEPPAQNPEPEEEPEPEQDWGEEARYMAQACFGEGWICQSKTEWAAIYWNILNRVDSDDPYYPDNIIGVVTQSAQYHGYDPTNPVLPVLKELALDVIDRWQREKQGETDVGRVLPPEYLFFGGDGKHNTFRTEWDGGEYWDWSWPSPYES